MIFADPRYGSGRVQSHRAVVEALTALGAEVEPLHLDFGDFAFFGNGPEGPIQIGVELKVIADFINSMQSGRLAEQVAGMSEKYQRSYLIVEGFYRSKRGSGLLEVPRGSGWLPIKAGPRPIFWADVEKFITSLEEAGVRVRRTRTSNETARVIVHVLCSFWEKEYSEHRSLQTLRQPSTLTLAREDEATARMRRMCVSLKTGIGYGRSKAVAEHFRSIHNMALADLHAWEGIAGIGKGIARGTLDAIHEEVGTRRLPQVKSTKASAGRVSARARVSTGRIRHSRRRQGARLDAASSAE